MDAGSLVLLVTAFALLLPLLPFALYRLARPFSLVNNTPLRLLAASTLVVDLFLALYATCALVALSGKAASTTVAVAAGAFTCLVTLVRAFNDWFCRDALSAASRVTLVPDNLSLR